MPSKLTKLACIPAMLCLTSAANAQALFTTTQTLDINNIKASSQVHGDMWHDTSVAVPGCLFPANSNKTIATAGALWIAGYDNTGQLKAAAQTYRQDGNDYWPGPLDATNTTITYTAAQNWAKIWKINRTDIQTFLSSSTHTQANTPAVILEWPAKGNPYAKGNNNVSLTITTGMAPFVDVNGDGNYNALQGDYPFMKGDQALWWVINDNGPLGHTCTQTSPFGMEIHNMAYGYKRNNVLDNVLFYEYDIQNKSGIAYDSLRIGLFADMDLRYAFNDYIGFDSSHRMGIVYNGAPIGMPDSNVMAGVSLVDITGDNCQYHTPAGSFISYNNDFTPQGNPHNGAEYNNLLSAHYRLGAALPNNAQYAYPDDPSIVGGNSECAQNDQPNDRRFVLASPALHLAGNGSVKLTFALIVDSSSNSVCPQATFAGIKTIADSVWNYFCTPPQNTGIANISIKKNTLKLYPNPAQQSIFIETTANSDNGSVAVYDAPGKMYRLPAMQKNSTIELNIQSLAPGVYTIIYRSNNEQQSGVFVKE